MMLLLSPRRPGPAGAAFHSSVDAADCHQAITTFGQLAHSETDDLRQPWRPEYLRAGVNDPMNVWAQSKSGQQKGIQRIEPDGVWR
ncbi:hypothetical protein [Streptomyces xanthochromogenes]|uniref:hypothetical protein n=1 Tax=Streptomyces xanthochromogenes TaxID=67384 RepID=UPI003815510C